MHKMCSSVTENFVSENSALDLVEALMYFSPKRKACLIPEKAKLEGY